LARPLGDWVLGLLLISHWATVLCGAESVDPSRFEKKVIYKDLTQPMELAVAPDGRIYVIELAGTLKVIDPETGQAQVVGTLEVTTEQENGLIGMALDPNFAENRWIYLQYSPPDFPGQHVSRFHLDGDRLDLASESILFSYEEQRRECCHHAGSLEFGPGGNLFIGTGDNTNPFNDSEGYAPLDERENRQPWDAQRTAGNTNSYNGKVLRIHPEPDGTYSIPDGNLFPKDGSIGRPEIYVMGCRNPWRISVDSETGYLYWGDVGPDAGSDGPRGPRGYDEVNQARTAGNFGWPYFIGRNRAYAMVDFESGEIGDPQDPASPENHSVNNTGSIQLPPAQPAFLCYPAAATDEYPEVGSGGRTACAGPVYHFDPALASETKFPSSYDNTLFAFEWSRNWIVAVHMDDAANIVRLERFLPDLTFTRPIDLQFDHQGALYVMEYGETWGVNPDAQLVRIDYVRGNRTPVAVADANNTVGREPLVVELSASKSFDKDGDPLQYSWLATRTTKDSTTRNEIGSSAETEVRFDIPGVYTIELVVRDSAGATSTTSLPVVVGNALPEIEFIEPQDGDFYTADEPIRYRVTVRDREDGTSDFDQAEEEGWHLIEAFAPSRLFVEAIPVAGEDASDVDPGLALIRKSDCTNCHAPNRRLVGPSFVEIAEKYRNTPHELEKSVARVLQGSTGIWGKVGMLPHSQHTEAEVHQMVSYVYAVSADSSHPQANGFTNELVVPEDQGAVRLEASYTDLGRGEVPAQIAVQSVTLRNRLVQAEAADEVAGTQRLGSANAQGNFFMGAINHAGYLRFDHVRMDQVSKIIARVASAGAGGTIEIRIGAPDGRMVGSAPVEVNGAWEEFYEKPIAIDRSKIKNGSSEPVYLVFKNEKNQGGLMNVDSIRFEP
jgi:cytochrome c